MNRAKAAGGNATARKATSNSEAQMSVLRSKLKTTEEQIKIARDQIAAVSRQLREIR